VVLWTSSSTGPGSSQAVPRPKALGLDFEAYIQALFSSVGWFVEPNAKEHDPLHKDLFECDAVFRRPGALNGQRTLVMEAKSGDWRVGDVVQLLGRSRYVEAEGSVFAYRAQTTNDDWEQRITPRLRELGLLSVRLPHDEEPSCGEVLGAAVAGGLQIGSADIELAAGLLDTQVHSFQLQRILRQNWGKLVKDFPDGAALEAAKRWNRQVYENLPLVADPVERLARQEVTYRTFGKDLAVRVAKDLGVIAPVATKLTGAHYDQGHDVRVQAALLLQHTARLAMIASVVDVVHLLSSDDVDAVVAGRDLRLSNQHWRSRVDSLRMRPESARWPLLWQAYLTRWGGFLLHERREEEMRLLGEEVGLSTEEVHAGLTLYDTFYPVPDGTAKWHAALDGGALDVLPGVPAALRGLGVLHRLRRCGLYTVKGDRAQVAEALTDEWATAPTTAGRLSGWFDIGVSTLLGTVG
jgi:hypothetical protein